MPALPLALLLLIPPPTGDQVLETTTEPVIAVVPPAALLDAIDSLDAVVGGEIRDAIAINEVGFVTIDSEGNFGVHDYNTIGYAASQPIWIQAVSIIHEWDHVTHSPPVPGGVPGQPGYLPPHDDRIGGDCFACIHLEQMIIDLENIDAIFCELAPQGFERFDYYEAYQDVFQIACRNYNKCKNAGLLKPACEAIAGGAVDPDTLPQLCFTFSSSCKSLGY